MKKKKSSPNLSQNKKGQSSSIEKSLKYQLSPLLKISQEKVKKKLITIKSSPYQHYIGKSTRITSLNSCQNSEMLQRKPSTEKLRHGKDGYPYKKKGNEKRNQNTTQRFTVAHLTKKNKAKEPRKSSKLLGRNFEFYKAGEDKWRKSLRKQFSFTNTPSVPSQKQQHHIQHLEEAIKEISSQSQSLSKTFLREALEGEENMLKVINGKNRVVIIDWMFLISASLSLNRATVHLAIHYMDSSLEKGFETAELHLLAAGSMLLSIKQEEREHQNDILSVMCMSEKIDVQKEQILEMERRILLSLNFKLKANTLPFWIDYFSLKWDNFVDRFQASKLESMHTSFNSLMKLRVPEGESYKFYRQLTTLSDVCVMMGHYRKSQKSKLALGCLYLVIRIQLEKQEQNKENISSSTSNLFKSYKKQFMKKATPIFRDPLNFNQIYNSFLTELCQYELTEIIPTIKDVAQFLDIDFSYQIDQKTFDQCDSYEQFIQCMTYNQEFKQYSLNFIQSTTL